MQWFQPSTHALTKWQQLNVVGDELGLFHLLKLQKRLDHKHKYLDLDGICSKCSGVPMTQQVQDKYNYLYFREFLEILPITLQIILLRIHS